ncbi:NTP transferase domain-containing protein [Candidatus Poribacteria bacterium]
MALRIERTESNMADVKVNGVILTGKRAVHNQFLMFACVDNKAMIDIDGKAMIQHVIDALNESQYVKNIYLVVPEDFEAASFDSKKPLSTIPSGDTAVESLLNAIHGSGEAEKVIITTCDNPLFRGFMLDEFIQRCLTTNADFCYSVGRESVISASYPEVKRTYVQAKDDGYTGANVYFVDKKDFSVDEEMLVKIDSYRKTPWRYVRLIGKRTLVKFALKRITLEDVEKRASEIIGCKFRLIPMPFPVCGIDVDKPSDLVLVRKLMKGSAWQQTLLRMAS